MQLINILMLLTRLHFNCFIFCFNSENWSKPSELTAEDLNYKSSPFQTSCLEYFINQTKMGHLTKVSCILLWWNLIYASESVIQANFPITCYTHTVQKFEVSEIIFCKDFF